jgi:DNA-binding CsgD family transcriptional regulator
LGNIVVDYDKLVGSVYDCAANPELWPSALADIRDAVGGAYALVGYVDRTYTNSVTPLTVRRNSEWDEEWLKQLDALVAEIPEGEKFFFGPTDVAWTQMMHQTEIEFQQTPFYQRWVKPQNLRDTLNASYLQRDSVLGVLAIPSRDTRPLYDANDCALIERITPHIRRAVLINDISDKGRMATTLYRNVLDSLSVAVFVLGIGRRVVFTNGLGEEMLRNDTLIGLQNQCLQVKRSTSIDTALDDAIDRAAKGDAAIGIAGIGVPLLGTNGERAAAYVLPIAGKDVRGAMGQGHAVVFVARRHEQQPIAVEIMRTLFDLTVSEARVAAQLAQGENPQIIAKSLDVSVNTVRTHLKHTFAKTHTHDQTSLSGLVNGLLPPVRVNSLDLQKPANSIKAQ